MPPESTVSRALAPSVALHIHLGQGRELRRTSVATRRAGVRPRNDQHPTRSRIRLQVRCADTRRRPHPPQGDRPPPRVHRHHGCDGNRATSRSGSPRARTPRAETTCAPVRTASTTRSPRSMRASRASSVSCSSTSSSSRPSTTRIVPDWGTSYVQTAALGDRAVVFLDNGSPRPPAQTSSSSSCSFFDSEARRLRLQLALLYADDDLIVGARDPSSCSASSSRSSGAAASTRPR